MPPEIPLSETPAYEHYPHTIEKPGDYVKANLVRLLGYVYRYDEFIIWLDDGDFIVGYNENDGVWERINYYHTGTGTKRFSHHFNALFDVFLMNFESAELVKKSEVNYNLD